MATSSVFIILLVATRVRQLYKGSNCCVSVATGYTYVPHCYVVHTLPIVLRSIFNQIWKLLKYADFLSDVVMTGRESADVLH
jgi:hypothetical protein